MNEDMTSILAVMAEMNEFAPEDDPLSRIVARDDAGELREDDLEQVAAARARASYPDFLRKLSEKRREK